MQFSYPELLGIVELRSSGYENVYSDSHDMELKIYKSARMRYDSFQLTQLPV
jgi:hypothetical protein